MLVLLLDGYPLGQLFAFLAAGLGAWEWARGEGAMLAYARDERGVRLCTARRGWVAVCALQLGGYAPLALVVRWQETPQGPWRRGLLWRDSLGEAPYRALARVHRRLGGGAVPFF
jgi:hypothetical protein